MGGSAPVPAYCVLRTLNLFVKTVVSVYEAAVVRRGLESVIFDNHDGGDRLGLNNAFKSLSVVFPPRGKVPMRGSIGVSVEEVEEGLVRSIAV